MNIVYDKDRNWYHKTEIESFKIWQPCLGQESKQSSSSRQIQQHGEGEVKEGNKVII